MQKIQFQLKDNHNNITEYGEIIDLSTHSDIQYFCSHYHKITSLLSDEDWRLIDLSTNSEIITGFNETQVIWSLYQNAKIQKNAQLAYAKFRNDYNISESFGECYLGNNTSEEAFAEQYCKNQKLIHEDFPRCYINWYQLATEAVVGTPLGQWKYYYIDNICYVFQVIS